MPEGEAMSRSVNEKLADNVSQFSYEEAVARSLKMEARALQVKKLIFESVYDRFPTLVATQM